MENMMNQRTKEKLEKWARNKNWSLSHPLDNVRYNDFIIEAYKNGDTEISETEFYELISTYYNDENTLTNFYSKYENGIELLSNYEKK
jgi:hypothetical protein